MRRRKCRTDNRIGYYFSAFGLGMLVSLICPKTVTVTILSLAIIVLGIAISK